ncbi:TIGR02452 family protein [Streptomyces sp. TRM66268-LWL]|uniref:TIGR02452 family protein n=1 Tax=Streptomyces polyasparticus TaxID=2767826 RepID=A0ABR7SEJ9_9ACTN|nr:TIGR02452 family protein [Streptomyces polyasparticus]MBC9713838.1 TIGR02452 family protein [Streptomyces polyasparticus]
MSARLRQLARATETIVAAGSYTSPAGRTVDLKADIEAARAGTELHGPGPVACAPDAAYTTEFEVTGESSTQAARRLASGTGRPVAVLNFASARNPGGGFLNGAQAQEEALCRASALYTCLREAPEFYAYHREHRDAFYTDRVVHAPAVPVFRDDSGKLLEEPYRVGFLTSPAPNAGVIRRSRPDEAHRIGAALAARAERVLETAVAHGYRHLVLGAWGCGVFQNDPAQVAGAFRELLTGGGRFAGHFERVVFGVLDRQGSTRAAFEHAFPKP